MGHIVNSDREYRLLGRRLDGTPVGAPASPLLDKILELLYSPAEADLARQIPIQPTPLEKLSRQLGIPANALFERLEDMAGRGLVMDFEHEQQHYFAMSPILLGFFEFTFMRAREDMPTAELARLFEAYMHEDDRFDRSAYQGSTQIGRALVREEALPEENHHEVLDWERASRLVSDATAIGVSLCACRQKSRHLGKACDSPVDCCLSLNFVAESLVRNGLARPLSQSEAIGVLQQCKDAGLAQIGDNVQRKPAYICNCCGCCCEMMRAIRDFDIDNAVVTSNWIAQSDTRECTGCGQCAKACPIDAIEIIETDTSGPEKDIAKRGENGRNGKYAKVNDDMCLGCGVCYSACEFGALRMRPRTQRVVTPEDIFHRMVNMAIERGKLADLVFDDPTRLSHRALLGIVHAVEHSPVFKAAMAIKPLRSAFLNCVVREGKRRAGKFNEVFQ